MYTTEAYQRPMTKPKVRPRIITGLLAIIIGIQILSVMHTLFQWYPEVQKHPHLFTDAHLLLPFIGARQLEWRAAMLAGVISAACAVPLSVYLIRYFSTPNAVDESFLFIGTGAQGIDIVATLMSFLGTSYLAKVYPIHGENAVFLFNWSEAWRDEGLKTAAFLGIGVFTLRVAYIMRAAPRSRWIQFYSWLYGGFMVLIGLLDAAGKLQLGEYGIASGVTHVSYAVWGLAIGYWFWFRAPEHEELFGPKGVP
jgi:hypothetical protein